MTLFLLVYFLPEYIAVIGLLFCHTNRMLEYSQTLDEPRQPATLVHRDCRMERGKEGGGREESVRERESV